MKKAMMLVSLFLLVAVLAVCSAEALPTLAPEPTARPTAKPEGPYTLEEAELLVYDRLPDGEIVQIREDYDDGWLEFKGQAVDDEYVYEFEIDAETGIFLEWDMSRIRRRAEATRGPVVPVSTQSTESAGLIGTERAKEIALAQAGEGAQIKRIKLDREDGIQVYEGEGLSGWFEFEFEIDAQTGAILDWEWDD